MSMKKRQKAFNHGPISPFATIFIKFEIRFYKISLVETQYSEVFTSIALNKLMHKIGKFSNKNETLKNERKPNACVEKAERRRQVKMYSPSKFTRCK